jgi:hypothetical protein
MSKLRVTQKLHVVSFHCSKCGACCNSAPQLSLPELLHHQHRFIGCLTLRRVEHLRSGMRWAASAVATPADVVEFEAFVPSFLQSAPGRLGPELVWLASQAFDEPTLSRCPALGQDNLCTLQLDQKPIRQAEHIGVIPDACRSYLTGVRAEGRAYSMHLVSRHADPRPRPAEEDALVHCPARHGKCRLLGNLGPRLLFAGEHRAELSNGVTPRFDEAADDLVHRVRLVGTHCDSHDCDGSPKRSPLDYRFEFDARAGT